MLRLTNLEQSYKPLKLLSYAVLNENISMVARRENLANNSAGISFGYVIYMMLENTKIHTCTSNSVNGHAIVESVQCSHKIFIYSNPLTVMVIYKLSPFQKKHHM